MKILFISHYYAPHIGGVENHIKRVAKGLLALGNSLSILTEKYDDSLKNKEIIDEIKVTRFKYPHIKIIGLLYIWKWIWNNRKIIEDTDVIHCHDIFIWYLPFRVIYPKKPVYVTIHGLEWKNPLLKISLWQKKLAVKLSSGSIGIGKFLEKYIGVEFDHIIYGGMDKNINTGKKDKDKIVYVGRLEGNTGLGEFLKWLEGNKQKYSTDFCGDGPLHTKCKKYGTVHGFCDPKPYYKKAEICVPGGYLAYLEAKSYGCRTKVFWNNQIKKEYWAEIEKVRKFPTWGEVAKIYENQYLHNRI